MKTIVGSGVKQAAVVCGINVWTQLAAVNNNRSWLHIQNVGAGTLYLYHGQTAPVDVTGAVAFRALKPTAAGTEYDEFISGEDHAMFRDAVWGLAKTAGTTAQVGEF